MIRIEYTRMEIAKFTESKDNRIDLAINRRVDEKMKCVVLAFDALERRFVGNFDLDNIMQQEYGEVTIPPDCFINVKTDYFPDHILEPQTPLVWFSFLTGKTPSEVHFSPTKWKSQILNILCMNLNKIPLITLFRNLKINDILLDFLKPEITRSTIQDYDIPTIFGFSERSYGFNVPLYTENWQGWGYGLNPNDFGDFQDFTDAVLKKHKSEFEYQSKDVLRFLERKNQWELFMAYFYVLDPYGELCFDRPNELLEIYSAVDNFVEEAKKRLDESFVLVVSDHGIERLGDTCFGKHSDHAFYSTNLAVGLNNPKITDFYSLIKKVLTTDAILMNMISEQNLIKMKNVDADTHKGIEKKRDIDKEAEKKVKDRLKALGYLN